MPKSCVCFASWGKITYMVLHGRIRTGSDWWFSKILWIRTGLDSVFADQDWTRTEKFHSPLISAVCTHQHMIIAAGLTLSLVAKAVLCMVLFDYQDLWTTHCEVDAQKILFGLLHHVVWTSRQYFGEINWGFSFSMQFFEAV